MDCTIAKRSAKRLKFLNPDPFTKRESAVSNFHPNLYEAIKSHNITAPSAPDFGHALFKSPPPPPPRGIAHVSILFFCRIYQTEDFVSSAIFWPFYFVFGVSSFKGAHWLLHVSVAVGRTDINAVKVLLRQRTLDNMNVR